MCQVLKLDATCKLAENLQFSSTSNLSLTAGANTHLYSNMNIYIQTETYTQHTYIHLLKPVVFVFHFQLLLYDQNLKGVKRVRRSPTFFTQQ